MKSISSGQLNRVKEILYELGGARLCVAAIEEQSAGLYIRMIADNAFERSGNDAFFCAPVFVKISTVEVFGKHLHFHCHLTHDKFDDFISVHTKHSGCGCITCSPEKYEA